MRKLFKTILSFADVEGVFYLDDRGKVVSCVLPEPFTEDTFKNLTRSIINFFETADVNQEQTDEYFLKFNEHTLYLRRNGLCILGVFTSKKPDVSRLREACWRSFG